MGNEAHDSSKLESYFDSSIWERAATKVDGVAQAVALGLQCDEVYIVPVEGSGVPAARYSRQPLQKKSVLEDLFSIRSSGVFHHDVKVAVPLIVHDLQRARLAGNLTHVLAAYGVRSFGLFPLKRDGEIVAVVACLYQRAFHRFTAKEIDAVSALVSVLLPANESVPKASNSSLAKGLRSQYQRLANHGNIVIITTDKEFRVTDVFGNTEALLGVSPQSMRGDVALWGRILDPRDIPTLRRRITKLRRDRSELREEVRVLHQKTGKLRWIMLRALPQFSVEGVFLGWEGFGVDVTDRRYAQDRLVEQNRRLEALFEVARALHGYADPAAVTFKGLRAVVGATQSDCGYACFYDRERDALETVAAIGLSEQYLDNMDPILKGPSLLRVSVASKSPLLIDDLQADPRANRELAKQERQRACIIAPMIVDNEVCGAFCLFKRDAFAYAEEDFDLATAAAAQISLAIRQAEIFDVQKQQSASLRSLYSVSRELAKYRSAHDFAERIFPILKEEFALKQGWLGVLNEQGTFLLGRAGFGGSSNDVAQDLQIEVTPSEKLLYKVVASQRPAIINDLSGHREERLLQAVPSAERLVAVPMVAVGQVLGILVVEPLSKTTFVSSERIRLLVSMASEIATVMLAGRFEHKMSEALRMRTAGLLASGVAHNFNNLLQAILGQVTLIEMQTQKGSPVFECTGTITEAAKRGASLVSQLLSFATNGSSTKKPISLARMIVESEDLYRSLVGKKIAFSIDAGATESAAVLADVPQMQQVLTNLLANAKDAIGTKDSGAISISMSTVSVRSGELAPDVSPGPYIRIDVKDNGVGMTPEQQARCFEPFFTTKNVDQGTGVGLNGSGLGLSTAYSLVRQHDGLITVYSVPGEGAIVSVYIPIFSAQGAFAEARSSANMVSARGQGVLLLGMESGVQPFVSSVLESLGYASRGVFDARQTIDVLRREAGRWSVVMIDADGLGSQAASTCTQLLSQFPELTIVCVGVLNNGRLGAAFGDPSGTRIQFVEKPLSVWSVEEALAKLTRGDQSSVDSGHEFDPSSAERAAM